MVEFYFTVNKPFVKYANHPITVPRTQVDYADLENKGLDRRELKIQYEHGEWMPGYMHSGSSGYGPFYQLRHSPPYKQLPTLKKGDQVLVKLRQGEGHTLVTITKVDG